MQDAIDAIPYLHPPLKRLHVYITGAFLNGLAQDQVDQLHNRGFLRHPLQITDLVLYLVQHLHVIFSGVGQHLSGVVFLHKPTDLVGATEDQFHLTGGHHTDILGSNYVEWVRHRHAQRCGSLG